MNPLISVIVPVYKVESFLDKCVKSIVNQSFTNLEIILVDDGSPDNCPQLCDEWAKKDDRIKIIHKCNGGLSSARNAGIDICTGDYIAFVDSDDYVDNNYIEKLYDALSENDADMSVCGVEKLFLNGRESEFTNIKNELLSKCDYFDKLEGVCGWCWVVAWNKLYKRSIFTQLRYPEGVLYEDDCIIHKIIYSVDRIATIEDNLYYYVQRENSIVNSGFSQKKLLSCKLYLERCSLFIEKKEAINRIDFCLDMAIKSLYSAYSNNVEKSATKDFVASYRAVWKRANDYKFSLYKRMYYSLNCYFSKMLFGLKRLYSKIR